MLSASQWTSQGTILTCQGPSGLQGPQGPTGPTGPSGPQGPTGTRGNQGSLGDGGIGGFNPDGPPGPFSFIGDNGPSGAIGPSGPAGPQGNTGATGPRGPSGPIGPSGAVGMIGRIGPSGARGGVGPTGPTGPAAENYILTAQGTKFYASTGAQIVYTFSDLDRNILNYAGYYRLTAADLTTATGPIARSPVHTTYEFMIMPTQNYRTSSGPATGGEYYFGNIIQTIPQGSIIENNSVNIFPTALQPVDLIPAIAPNDKINDNSSQYNARYNIVLYYTGTREMLLNWYLYKANLQLPVVANLTYHVCLFHRLQFYETSTVLPLDYTPIFFSNLQPLLPHVSPLPDSPHRINPAIAAQLNASLPSGVLAGGSAGFPWLVGTFTIPSGIYTVSGLDALLESQLSTIRGMPISPPHYLYDGIITVPPLSAVCSYRDGRPNPPLLLTISAPGFFNAANRSMYEDRAVGLFFGPAPNASTFMGCGAPGGDPAGIGLTTNSAILILRPGPTTSPPHSTDEREVSRWPVRI
jgi:hypothetical protein